MIKTILFSAMCLLPAVPAAALTVPPDATGAELTMPGGAKVKVELARTPKELAQGLMYRKELPEDRGMLFVFPEGGKKVFWMKNTFISLDIIFMDKDLKISNIYHRVPPGAGALSELEIAKVSAPAHTVLELAAGAARKYGLKPGYRVPVSFPSQGKKNPAPKDGGGKKK